MENEKLLRNIICAGECCSDTDEQVSNKDTHAQSHADNPYAAQPAAFEQYSQNVQYQASAENSQNAPAIMPY